MKENLKRELAFIKAYEIKYNSDEFYKLESVCDKNNIELEDISDIENAEIDALAWKIYNLINKYIDTENL